jgi:hypothetical protein
MSIWEARESLYGTNYTRLCERYQWTIHSSLQFHTSKLIHRGRVVEMVGNGTTGAATENRQKAR